MGTALGTAMGTAMGTASGTLTSEDWKIKVNEISYKYYLKIRENAQLESQVEKLDTEKQLLSNDILGLKERLETLNNLINNSAENKSVKDRIDEKQHVIETLRKEKIELDSKIKHLEDRVNELTLEYASCLNSSTFEKIQLINDIFEENGYKDAIISSDSYKRELSDTKRRRHIAKLASSIIFHIIFGGAIAEPPSELDSSIVFDYVESGSELEFISNIYACLCEVRVDFCDKYYNLQN